MKRVAILQSNYIPWKGYFDVLNMADEFIIYDIAQFTKNDWRNRNKIMTPQGPAWITIPVIHRFGQKIEETRIADSSWRNHHWGTILRHYGRARYFADYADVFAQLYREDEQMLSLVNLRFIEAICRFLGITTRLTSARDYSLVEGRTERLVDLCRQAGATCYLSGPSAREYLEESLFERAGIMLEYMDYSGYPEYEQLYQPFDHAVSIIDLLFNEGPDATAYMKSFGRMKADQ